MSPRNLTLFYLIEEWSSTLRLKSLFIFQINNFHQCGCEIEFRSRLLFVKTRDLKSSIISYLQFSDLLKAIDLVPDCRRLVEGLGTTHLEWFQRTRQVDLLLVPLHNVRRQTLLWQRMDNLDHQCKDGISSFQHPDRLWGWNRSSRHSLCQVGLFQPVEKDRHLQQLPIDYATGWWWSYGRYYYR